MAAKRRKKSKAGKIIYWILLIAFTAVLAFGASVVLGDVHKYLVAYENAQPDGVIESHMEQLKSTVWDSKISELAASMPHPFQTNEEAEELLRDEMGANLTYQRSGGNSSSGITYDLLSTNDPNVGYYKVGSVTLKQDFSKASQIDIGLMANVFSVDSVCPWYVSDSSFDLGGFGSTSSYKFTCPSTYTVTLNGHQVGAEYITETGIQYDEFKEFYAEHPNLPTKSSYSVENLVLGSVEPVFYDRNGQQITVDEKSKTVTGNLTEIVITSMDFDPPSDSEQDELRAFANSFISPYLNYFGTMSVNANAAPLRDLIVSGCDIDKRMTEFLDGAQWIHYWTIEISRYDIVAMYALGDGFYVIDIDYEATAYGEYKNVSQASNLRVVVCRTDMGLKAISAE